MEHKKITIIGLGLIGGSLAKALHEKLGIREIIAVDNDKKALGLAAEQGVISSALREPDQSVYDSDIIFICTPVNLITGYIDILAGKVKDTCIITDTGSIKGEVAKHVEKMPEQPCFIGGHPMAGTEKSGFVNSLPHLFENAYYILTPGSAATPESVSVLSAVIEGIGAIPLIMSADDHDQAAGGISHLPHVLAAALVNLVKDIDKGTGRIAMLAAGGFRDITRIASSNPDMWRNIVLTNRDQLLELLKMLNTKLSKFACRLENGDSEAIYDFFSEARQFRDSISDHGQGLLPRIHQIIVDVRDRPGIIGEIATILAAGNINIKNINVANSREFEHGCLVITLPDIDSANIAFDLLSESGYKVYMNK